MKPLPVFAPNKSGFVEGRTPPQPTPYENQYDGELNDKIRRENNEEFLVTIAMLGGGGLGDAGNSSHS